MSDKAVVITGLTKNYTKGDVTVTPLKNLYLNVDNGGFIVLMGPSGSGKSTLLNLVAGIDRPTEGRIVVTGEDISLYTEDELAEWRTRAVGYIFQQFNLLPVLTAYENVELPLLLLPLTPKKRRNLVEAALEVVGLQDRAGFYPSQMSGGQEQRTAIARAIACDPALLLADEPTGNLDRETAQGIMELFAELNKRFGKTIIIVSHDSHFSDYAGRLLHLDKGELKDPREGN